MTSTFGFRLRISCLLSFQIQITINEFQIEFELIDAPTAVNFCEMEIIAADKGARVLRGWIRQVVKCDAVTKRCGYAAVDGHGIISGLMVNGFQILETSFPGAGNLPRGHF